jgi:hypothetical protein
VAGAVAAAVEVEVDFTDNLATSSTCFCSPPVTGKLLSVLGFGLLIAVADDVVGWDGVTEFETPLTTAAFAVLIR